MPHIKQQPQQPAIIEAGTLKPGKTFIPILAVLMAFTSLSTDIYLPAMPTMQHDLQGNIELTITGFLVGFAIAQIFWGPISDRYGRKLPLVLGIILFVVGSIGCALSNSMPAMVAWRIVQALGACTGPMLARAMVRDVYEKKDAARMLSGLMILMAIAPIIGPLIGGQILKFSTWHSIFWLLAAIGMVMLAAVFLLPETLRQNNRSGRSLAEAFSKYKILLGNGKYMRYTLCLTFFYVAAYAYIAGSPAVYITYFKVQPQYYGYLFAVNVLGLVGFSFLNRRLINRYSLDFILRIATIVSMISGIILAFFAWFNLGGLAAIVVGVFFFFSMNGFIAACATAAALDDVPEMAGAASALLGSLQYGSGILSTVLLSVFSDGTPLTMCIIIAVFATAATLVMKPWRLVPNFY